MTASEKKQLMDNACKVRMGVIESTYGAKSGHPGGSLSASDLFTYLYFREMKVDPADPKWEERDRFVLSKGHTAPGLYAALALKGFFPWEELKTLRHIGSRLQGHPNMNETPGVDMAAKYQGKDCRIYTLLGDGEIEEGQPWEAFMFAHQYKLDNLCVIIDNNNLQIDGKITDVMSPYPIPEKLRAFGFQVREIDGHDFEQMESAFDEARATKGVPFAIIMTTIKGKGVSFMENNKSWHHGVMTEEQYRQAKAELEEVLA